MTRLQSISATRHPAPRLGKTLGVLVVLILMGVGAFNIFRIFRGLCAALLVSAHTMAPAAKLHQLPKGPDPGIQKRVLGRISDLRQRGREMAPCPLLFPLLDKEQRVTPVGSYLSYLGMKRASYLPEAVFRLPNVGDVFQKLELFTPGPRPLHALFRQELPFRFMAKDFGEGTCLETADGVQLALRFWGARPEKRYSRTFPRDQLQLAPGWIAASIHDWVGYQPTPTQARFMASPVFANAGDLVRGAHLEPLFRNDPGLVDRWDQILARNPGDAFLFDRWLSMTNAREYGSLLETVAPRFSQSPRDCLLRMDYVAELSHAKRHEEAFGLLAEDLEKDDNDADLYQWAVHALDKLECHAEGIQLLELWRDKHPDNQEAWIALAEAYRAYAWVARGDGWANTVTAEGWRLMRERMGEAVKAATRATQLAPRDCRTWTALLACGTGAPLPREKMAECFAQVLALNPQHYPAYAIYANYLKPKWFGDEEQVQAFADQYQDRFPLLTYDVVTEGFWDRAEEPRDEAGKRAKIARQAERVRLSPRLGAFEERMRAHLGAHPWDVKSWNNFMFWMVKIGKRDETLAFARSILTRADPELASCYPRLVLEALTFEEKNLVTSAEAAAFQGREDVVRLRGRALQDLVRADPANWAAWNQLAQFQVKQGLRKDAGASFERIGTHWVPFVWDKAAFEKARAQAAS